MLPEFQIGLEHQKLAVLGRLLFRLLDQRFRVLERILCKLVDMKPDPPIPIAEFRRRPVIGDLEVALLADIEGDSDAISNSGEFRVQRGGVGEIDCAGT